MSNCLQYRYEEIICLDVESKKLKKQPVQPAVASQASILSGSTSSQIPNERKTVTIGVQTNWFLSKSTFVYLKSLSSTFSLDSTDTHRLSLSTVACNRTSYIASMEVLTTNWLVVIARQGPRLREGTFVMVAVANSIDQPLPR